MTVNATPDARWAALVANDRTADGSFVYAVLTTGIACRPSCPSRTPNRENVRFYDDFQQAQAAGFRTCKRCHPDQGDPVRDAILRVCRHIDAATKVPPVGELARVAGMAESTFHRAFKRLLGVTPRAYAASAERDRLRAALLANDQVGDAVFDAGFASAGRFYERTDDLLGMPPTVWRAGGEGVEVCFATAPCTLGHVLVACSRRGIVSISLGDDPDALASELRARLPNAALIDGEPAFDKLICDVVAFVDQPRRGLDLPLDIRGTAFQQRVWQALRRIPAGETRSYADIARDIGRPTASRAVAGACASNTLAVVVPCHRVVRGDGALSGYRWGTERKRALLDREKTR